ncbi:MAG: translocation/assembly module TamB domain-containing protein [Bryobacterales bacterium]|nr:translocation/assembly module TamB domain-containing protein [Bryobacterales bacterium]
MKRFVRRLIRTLLILAALCVLAGIAGFLLIRTQWARNQIRMRIVSAVEAATGGRTELKSFDFDPVALRVTVKGFVLHGKEPDGAPLASAGEIRAGVKVVSLASRKAYLESLEVDKPDVRIIIFPDGSNNIPGPKIPKPQGKSVFEQFVDISARHFVLKDGMFTYDNRKVPIELSGENLKIDFGWESDGPRYRGVVSAEPFHFRWPKVAPLDFDTRVELTMDKNGLQFQHAQARRGKSLLRAAGWMKDYRSPKLDLNVEGEFLMREWAKEMHLPVEPTGSSHFQGRFTYGDGVYVLAGPVHGQGLAVRRNGWSVEGIRVTADVRLEPEVVTFAKVHMSALEGDFDGAAAIRHWRGFEVRGAVSDLALEEIRRVEATARPLAWSSAISGPVQLDGLFAESGVRNFVMQAHLVFEPAETKIPLEGTVNFRYQQEGRQLSFESSYLKTPRTRVDFTGDVAKNMRVMVDTTDLNDFLPAAALVSENPFQSLPAQLDGGSAHLDGQVSAPLDSPRFNGRVRLTKVVYEKQMIDSVSADVEVDAAQLAARNVSLTEAGSTVAGDLRMSLEEWRATERSSIQGQVNLRQVSIDRLTQGRELPVVLHGTISAAGRVDGTLGSPSVSAKLNLSPVTVDQEPFDSIRGNLVFHPDLIEFTEGEAVHRAGRIPFSARYEHPREVWNSGHLTFDLSARNGQLGLIHAVRATRQDIDGKADLKASGSIQIDQGQPHLQSIQGSAAVRQFTLAKTPIGGLSVELKTQGELVSAKAAGDLLGSPIKGSGEWQIRGDAVGLGTLELGTLTISKARQILAAAGFKRPIPLDGAFRGEIVVSGALLKPRTLRARANLSDLTLTPQAGNDQITSAVLQELTLRNNGPVVFEADEKGLQVVQAQLTGKETNIQLSGNIATSARNAWNIVLKGGLNLGIFQNYVPGLRTSGSAIVNATVRGTLDEPLLGGRMEIKDATVIHRDIPNSIEKANGLVAFDRNRALLQNFTAQSGGGELKLNGFVTFPTGDEQITYRINGQLDHIRIRYPEGASTTVNANLSLTGTADQSLLSGVVTVLRSGFTPRTDIGSLLLEPSKPIQAPTSSAFLRGMQFDVRMVSAPNLVLETSLTRGLQTEVELRVRGSPSKPIILGNVSVTQGELNFFGTTYHITRGTVSFFNAARIEPVLDLDLETSVRAITVSMNISGPIDKPNITYRSDPPLQPSDIIALLAVGRTPVSSTTVATPTNVGGTTNTFFAGTDTLLGQALSSSVSGRLQRFFGVSRVKIDPQLTGVESTPQARLTIEQQISRDITLTYVTNLTGTLQQLVQLQWDIRKNWSLIGVRDENGVAGADILYRKRFK